jgi:bla regulator protein blaR1
MITVLLKIITCSGILWLFYLLVLSPEKMFRFNRFYLLFSIFFSLIVPFIHFESGLQPMPFSEPARQVKSAFIDIEEKMPAIITSTTPDDASLNPYLLVYCIITCLLSFRLIRNLVKLTQGVRTDTVSYNGATLVLTNKEILPYSFLKFIFISKTQFQKGLIEKEIIQHELAHIRQKHSIDILLVELVTVFFWFNPFIYAFKKALRLNHEFLADKEVIGETGNTRAYQRLLLHKIATSGVSLASSFNYLITKKRLIMMTKNTSPTLAFVKGIFSLTLMILIVVLFSTRTFAQEFAAKTVAYVSKRIPTVDTPLKAPWIRLSIGSTSEGVSPALLKEYTDILAKHQAGETLVWADLEKLSTEEKSRLLTIFKQMNREQQSLQSVIFVQPFKPLNKAVPTEKQFSAFKNSRVYGVWLNGKKISNSELNNYTYKDFSYAFTSKLYGVAKKGKSYTHQVDMMTNSYYQNYHEKAMKRYNKALINGQGEMVLIGTARNKAGEQN